MSSLTVLEILSIALSMITLILLFTIAFAYVRSKFVNASFKLQSNIISRAPKPTRVRPADLPPSYNVVMENSDMFQTIATHEKPETPPPSFQSQVDQPPPIENDLTHRNHMRQTVLTIS